MMMERIVCDARTGKIVRESIESGTPACEDYAALIAICQEKLAATDYVAIKIAEGAATREEYSEVLAERAALRARINELEARIRA